MINRLDDLYEAIKQNPPKKIVIAAAEEKGIIKLVGDAVNLGIADFILVGDKEKIRALLIHEDIDYKNLEITDRPDHREAAEEAVKLVNEGKANVIMKGDLHTATFLKAVLDKNKGLRKGDLISQITVYEKMEGEGLQLLTDCAMNIAPSLEEKKQIINNAVDLALKLGYEKPRVALLSALEAVNIAIPDTVDAAILSKMADRGQIKNAVIDGPFALDNAISIDAARQKNIHGEVAGRADIVMVPNLQVGNALHKALTYFANKRIAAAIMGTTAPIVMTSRTDPVDTKLLSIALAIFVS